MVKLNIPYICKHCKKQYVILHGKYKYSILPVDVRTGTEKDDLYFDKSKHVSHLLSCQELQSVWENVKKMYREREWKLEKLAKNEKFDRA